MKRRVFLVFAVLLQTIPSPAAERVLRVLTYNIHGIPLPGVTHDRYKDIGAILRERRRNGTAPQIVAIQEAFVSRTDELVKEAGYPYSKRGPSRSGGALLNSGLLLLSEFPLSEPKSIRYERCAGFDCLASKGVQAVRVKIPGMPGKLSFLNTHMNSDSDGNPDVSDFECQMARWAQFQETRDFLFDLFLSNREAVIYSGDFNCTPASDEFRSFASWSNLGLATDPRHSHETAIDHQFYASGASPRVRLAPTDYRLVFTEPFKGRKLSDHDGVEIDYRVSW